MVLSFYRKFVTLPNRTLQDGKIIDAAAGHDRTGTCDRDFVFRKQGHDPGWGTGGEPGLAGEEEAEVLWMEPVRILYRQNSKSDITEEF